MRWHWDSLGWKIVQPKRTNALSQTEYGDVVVWRTRWSNPGSHSASVSTVFERAGFRPRDEEGST
jgi:hypothetical protein